MRLLGFSRVAFSHIREEGFKMVWSLIILVGVLLGFFALLCAAVITYNVIKVCIIILREFIQLMYEDFMRTAD